MTLGKPDLDIAEDADGGVRGWVKRSAPIMHWRRSYDLTPEEITLVEENEQRRSFHYRSANRFH